MHESTQNEALYLLQGTIDLFVLKNDLFFGSCSTYACCYPGQFRSFDDCGLWMTAASDPVL